MDLEDSADESIETRLALEEEILDNALELAPGEAFPAKIMGVGERWFLYGNVLWGPSPESPLKWRPRVNVYDVHEFSDANGETSVEYFVNRYHGGRNKDPLTLYVTRGKRLEEALHLAETYSRNKRATNLIVHSISNPALILQYFFY